MQQPQQMTMFGGAPAGIVKPVQPFTGTIIYETRGKAREYRELACNLYSGCDHKCLYCYAPDVMSTDRSRFGSDPMPRADIIAKLDKDARRYGQQGETRQVMFCFTCDPYQSIDKQFGLTRQAILTCHRHGLNVCTLTKGGSRALRDIDLFTPADAFASTLTTLEPSASLKWEPGGALPADRMATLKAFHERGIPTWVSLEPVVDPEATLEIIRLTRGYVDEFKAGVLNYHPRAKEIDWRKFARDVKGLLDKLDCRYYLKQDLLAYLR